MPPTHSIRVELPLHLCRLAGLTAHELTLDVADPVTIANTLTALEDRFPMLRGAIRDHVTLVRRPFLRFFVSEEDWSHNRSDDPLPASILDRCEPLLIIGAIAGG